MFVYHYVIIPFHPQYLPRHAPQGGGIQGGGIGEAKPTLFLYLYILNTSNSLNFPKFLIVLRKISIQNWHDCNTYYDVIISNMMVYSL